MPDWPLQAINTRKVLGKERAHWSWVQEGFLQEVEIALDHTENVGVERHRGRKRHTVEFFVKVKKEIREKQL